MSKGRLRPEFLERILAFCDRCVAVAEQLQADHRFGRVVDQLAASGSSFGANCAEAGEAMSTKDFRKCLAIANKELAETRFWLQLSIRRGWLAPHKLEPLLAELEELNNVVGTILLKTRAAPVSPRPLPRPHPLAP